jgi:hypothetical protein
MNHFILFMPGITGAQNVVDLRNRANLTCPFLKTAPGWTSRELTLRQN